MDVPSILRKVQVESTRFRSPVSENLIQTMAATINYIVDSLLPVGTITESMLTESQFQTQVGTTNWVLADGRSVTGSSYESVTGFSTIPDLRGVFRRGKNNGRSTATGNSNGDVAVGTFHTDQFVHVHEVYRKNPSPTHDEIYPDNTSTIADLSAMATKAAGRGIQVHDGGGTNTFINDDMFTGGATTQGAANFEVQVRNVTTNVFIRIN